MEPPNGTLKAFAPVRRASDSDSVITPRRLPFLTLVAGAGLAGVLLAMAGLASGAPAGAETHLALRELTLTLSVPGPGDLLHVSMFVLDEPGVDMPSREAAGRSAILERFPGAVVVDPAPGALSGQFVLFGVRWPSANASWVYNGAGRNPSLSAGATLDAIRVGSQGWDNAGGSGWRFDYAGETVAATGCDGRPGQIPRDSVNTVGWGHIVGGFAGFTCWWSSGPVVPGTSFNTITEMDVIFESDVAFSATSLRNLALHEFGHALGLDHTEASKCPGQAMCGGSNASLFAQPQPDDIAGVVALYGVSTTPTPTPTATASPTATRPASLPFRLVAQFVARQ